MISTKTTGLKSQGAQPTNTTRTGWNALRETPLTYSSNRSMATLKAIKYWAISTAITAVLVFHLQSDPRVAGYKVPSMAATQFLNCGFAVFIAFTLIAALITTAAEFCVPRIVKFARKAAADRHSALMARKQV